MAEKKPRYQVQTGDRGHQAPGLSSEAKRSLEERGLLKKKPQKKSKSKSKKSPKRSREPKSTTRAASAAGPEADLPARSRRKVERRARHFRFIREIDDKLQDLVEHYDGTMTYVMSRLIHDEWVRMKRKERRSARSRGDEDEDDEGSDSSPDEAAG